LGGRNFESFSEDPYLAGKLAAQNVLGVESMGVSATIKHFVANEQETQRLSVDEIISERALREIYLKPFEIAVKEAKPGAVMTAYNKVNGHHADSQTFLLQQVLRGEWGWDGLVMSDWGGTNSVAAALNAGLDLEMPGPTRWRKVEDVLQAIKAGEVSEQTIDIRTLHVLQFLERQKCFDDPKIPEEQAINKPEHQSLIREAGAKGIVLLKNDGGVLPLTKEKVQGKKIAIFGLAKECLSNGGGSASVNAHYKISPWDALSETWKDDNVELVFAEGLYESFRWRESMLINLQVPGLCVSSRSLARTSLTTKVVPASLCANTTSARRSLTRLSTDSRTPNSSSTRTSTSSTPMSNWKAS
jgi:beta-glucosidase